MKITIGLGTAITIIIFAFTIIIGLGVYIHDRDVQFINNNTKAIEAETVSRNKLNETLINLEKTIDRMIIIDKYTQKDIDNHEKRIERLETK